MQTPSYKSKEVVIMYIRTVAFFGHRQVDDYFEIRKQVETVVRNLMSDRIYTEFLVGRNGEFDELAASVVREVRRDIGEEFCSLVLILPYVSTNNEDYWKQLEGFYDEIEVCDESAQTHYKSAFRIRNRNIVDRADKIIFYVKRKKGGAYEAMKYAEKTGKEVISLDCFAERV